MACECTAQHGTVRVADGKKFAVGKSDKGKTGKIHLFKCDSCGQFWLIDEWEKFKERLAFKIKDDSHWPLRKAYLLIVHGGTSAENCTAAGCKGKKVKGTQLCVDHYYTSDAIQAPSKPVAKN
jgi:hypothetical protein